MPQKKKVIVVVGARPQFIKAAIVSRHIGNLGGSAPYEEILVHTGQHYDANMSQVFFDGLNIPPPKYNLEVGSMGPSEQIAQMILRFDPILKDEKPDAVMVYGDTNSTLAAGIVASRHNIPLIHVESGERQFFRTDAPEEINRIVTDHLAALCLAVSQDAMRFLKREGMSPDRLKFVGDPMHELFLQTRDHLNQLDVKKPSDFNLNEGEYILATIHRAENTRDRETLVNLLHILDTYHLPVLLPAHPRVSNLLSKWDWQPSGNLKIIEPLNYFDLISLLQTCRSVFTDSGGVVREAFFSGKPALVPMPQMAWTRLIEIGFATLVDHDQKVIHDQLDNFMPHGNPPTEILGDGNSSRYIVEYIGEFLEDSLSEPPWHYHGYPHLMPKPVSSDMTYDNYRRIIEAYQSAGYVFASFLEAESLIKEGTPFVLYRHDIAVDLQKALKMAKIEAEMGIRTSYFFMLRTDHYNLFSDVSTWIVREILNLGHHLGLHFDVAAYPDEMTIEEQSSATRREVDLLSNWFDTPVSIISYHRPNQHILSGDPQISAPLPHTYMNLYSKQMEYCSDSRGEWRYGGPLEREAFKQRQPMQFLTHPIWWREVASSPYHTMLDITNEKLRRLELNLASKIEVSRVGWIKNVLANPNYYGDDA